MKYILHYTLMCLAVSAAAVFAQDPVDFSKASQARSWNLYGEMPARFEATVVDVLCELSGDCAADCGAGRRQLGLLRAADNVLVFPNKNAQPLFTGATVDLLPYCGERVEVDGLLIEDDFVGATNIYLVQAIKRQDEQEWVRANQWTKQWGVDNPSLKSKSPWFRHDKRVLSHLQTDGYFGLGLDEDEAIKRELLQ